MIDAVYHVTTGTYPYFRTKICTATTCCALGLNKEVIFYYEKSSTGSSMRAPPRSKPPSWEF